MNEESNRDDILNYFPRRDDEQIKRRERRRAWVGGISTALGTWFVLFVLVATNLPILSPQRPNVLAPMLAFGVIAALIGGIAIWHWTKGSRGFAIGALIGLGVALALTGVCFVAQMR